MIALTIVRVIAILSAELVGGGYLIYRTSVTMVYGSLARRASCEFSR
jgi:hypothetical protein